MQKSVDESHWGLATRVRELTQRWLQEYKMLEEVVEAVTTEQLLSAMLEETRPWVREHKPKTCAAAGELVDDHEQARKSGKLEVGSKKGKRPVRVPKCFSCGQLGYRSPDCPRARHPKERSDAKGTGGSTKPQQPSQRVERREPRCFECGKLGHISTRCPSRALYSEGRQCPGGEGMLPDSGAIHRSGTVDGSPMTDILLDTRCTRTLVHQRLVPRGRCNGEVVIRCAHGDEVSYPLTVVEIAVGGQVFKVEAGVSHTLPVSVLLGTDVPQLVGLLHVGKQAKEEREPEEALVVTMQTQAWKQAEEAVLQEQREQASGVQPTALGEGQVVPQAEDGVPAADEPSGETGEPVGVLGSEFDPGLLRTG